jgi:hypothetical protein
MSVILLFLLVMGRGRMYHDAQALSAALYQKLKLGVPRFTTSGTKKGYRNFVFSTPLSTFNFQAPAGVSDELRRSP